MRIVYQRSLLQTEARGGELTGSVGAYLRADGRLVWEGWAHDASGPIRGMRVNAGALSIDCEASERRDPASTAIPPEGPTRTGYWFRISVPLPEGYDLDVVLWVIRKDGAAEHVATALLDCSDEGQSPIFVMGSPRSGTSVIGLGLQQVMRLASYGESHLSPLIANLFETVSKFYQQPNSIAASNVHGVMLRGVDREEWIQRQARTLRQIYRELHSTQNFLDKTPGWAPLHALPALMQVWPNLRVVFAKRRGIDNVLSRMRVFHAEAFESHCRDWAEAMGVWLTIRETIPHSQRIEIDQHEIAFNPANEAARLGHFLGLSRESTQELTDILTHRRPQQTSTDLAQAVSLRQTEWTEKEQTIFLECCEGMMTSYGYSTGTSYYG